MACAKLRLEWFNITVVKDIKRGKWFKRTHTKKVILQGVNGVAEPGELLSIMGPSGGGKTSLLNVLSRRLRITEGKILLNGQKPPKYRRLPYLTHLDAHIFFPFFHFFCLGTSTSSLPT